MAWPIGSFRIVLLWMLGAAVVLASGCAEQQAHPESPGAAAGDEAEASEEVDTDPSVLADFRQPLEPYGHWVDDPTYGTVWVPNPDAVGPDFVHYQTSGHWALTDDDLWMWVSDYEWGWAPFHYGRWVWIDGTGWAWIPGGVYAPAWVVWETGYYDEWYVGWAPMPPAWYWRGGVAVRVAVVAPARYVFVPSRHVFRPALRPYVLAEARVSTVAPHMQPYVSSGGRYQALSMARGPTPSAARVPAEAVPTQRVTRDARTTSFRGSTPGRAPVRAAPRAAPPRGGRGRGGGHHGR